MAPTSAPRRGRALAACACAALVFALAAVGPAAACGKPSYGSAAMADMDSYGDDPSASMAMEKNCTTVPEVLQSAGLNTLLAVVQAAAEADADFASGVAPLLGEEAAGLMAFAPTDAAFDALFAALNTTGPELLNASMPLVIDVLKYHVSPDMLDLPGVASVLGDESALAEISTLLPGETLMADEQMVEAACSNATVAAGPVETCSGMAYVIDAVLLPSTVCQPAGK